jgi:poly-gamma-glutamate synthesis protein (capsule biosynthesis protein)
MHWNYDLERLPMPMHRNIARKLIDVGASGVIGSHSHVPQGGEIYKGKPIVYGLGNFYLPSGIFFNGNLSYPEASKMTYALQINDDKLNILWFRTDSQGEIVSFDGMESFDGDRLKRISPFANMSDKEYISYFRKNRTKKLLVPVFVEYTGLKHSLQESYAITRVKVLRRLFKLLGR